MISRKDLLAGTAAAPQVAAPEILPPETSGMKVALASYRREDYPRILEIMADRSDLHDSYDDWLKDTQRVEQHLASTGRAICRPIIDPEKFLAWCEERDLKPVASSRSRYAIEIAKALDERGS
jgi:hypothetical protein